MSKGSKVRPYNRQAFNKGFDRIKWSGNLKHVNRRKARAERKGPHIIPDIEPYQAVGGDAAGQYISSRSHHREYLRRNNCVEVGNEKDYFFRHGGRSPDNPWVTGQVDDD